MSTLQGYVTDRNLEETTVGLSVFNNLGTAPIGDDISLFKNNTKNVSRLTVINGNIDTVTNTITIPNSLIVFSSGTEITINNAPVKFYVKNSNGKDTFQLSDSPNLQSTVVLGSSFAGTYVRSDAITLENIGNFSKSRRKAVFEPSIGTFNAFYSQFTTPTISNLLVSENRIATYNSTKINAYLTNNNIFTNLDFFNQGHTVINDPDNTNSTGLELDSGPGLFIYNFVSNTIVRAFSDYQNVWKPNLANTYLETTAKKVTVGALKITKDDVITVNQKTGSSPNIVIEGSSDLNITPANFTHTVKTIINGEEYFLCLSNTAAVSLSTTIETIGSVSLKTLANGNYALNAGGSDITITLNGSPISGQINGFSPILATTYLTGYALLLKTNNDLYSAWQLNSSGARTAQLEITSVQEFELLVDQDANGDGLKGYEAVVETLGNVDLKILVNGDYVFNAGGSDINITYKGANVNAKTAKAQFSGYLPFQIEAYSTGYLLLWISDAGNIVSWQLDSNGAAILLSDGFNVVSPPGSNTIRDFEILTNTDADGDGLIGYEKTLETNGTTTLKIAPDGSYVINPGTGDITITVYGGPAKIQNWLPWRMLQAEPYNNGYLLLWQNDVSGSIVAWKINSAGVYTEDQTDAGGISSVGSYEIRVNSDINNNGVIGS